MSIKLLKKKLKKHGYLNFKDYTLINSHFYNRKNKFPHVKYAKQRYIEDKYNND